MVRGRVQTRRRQKRTNMSLSTSQRLRLDQVKVGTQVAELREREALRQQVGSPKLAVRVRELERKIVALRTRNDEFVKQVARQRDESARAFAAAEDQHEESFRELRRDLGAGRTRLDAEREALLAELKPFREQQAALLTEVGQQLQRHLELRATAEHLHKNVTGTEGARCL